MLDCFFLHLQSPLIFVLLLFAVLFSFCFCSFLHIFRTDVWSTSQQISYEDVSLLDKLKSTVLAFRAPGTFLNYTRVFKRWRSFATEILGIVAVFPVEPIHCASVCFYSICWIQPSPFLFSIAPSTHSSGCMLLVSVTLLLIQQ